VIFFSHKEKDIAETISAFRESAELLSDWIMEGSEERMLERKLIRPAFQRY